jgi:hypothetical protein
MVGHVEPHNWWRILAAARDIVGEYPYLITLRQLHYRLVQTAGLGDRNTLSDYKQLSARTAEGRSALSAAASTERTAVLRQGRSRSVYNAKADA